MTKEKLLEWGLTEEQATSAATRFTPVCSLMNQSALWLVSQAVAIMNLNLKGSFVLLKTC